MFIEPISQRLGYNGSSYHKENVQKLSVYFNSPGWIGWEVIAGPHCSDPWRP